MELPEPYKSQAFAYEHEQSFSWDMLVSSQTHALSCGFSWNKTKEGGNYWSVLWLNLRRVLVSPNSPNSSSPIP